MNRSDLLTLRHIHGHSSLQVVKGYISLNAQDLLAQQGLFSRVDCLETRR